MSQIHTGLSDYLAVMQMSGLDTVVKPVPSARKTVPTIEPNIIPSEKQDEPVHMTTKQSKNISHLSKAERLRLLAEEVKQCRLCQELAQYRTQTVFGVGNPNAELVFIGEAPGATEDKEGVPFVGRAGQLLTDIIVKGMHLKREDVYICNVLRCRPPDNRTPTIDEAKRCRPFLDQTLDIIHPKYICCLGAPAAQNLLSSTQTIGAMRGKIYEYKGAKVVCTYHPAYLLRSPDKKKETWKDIQLLMQEMK